jgi:glyoxylase-like metal-dependent hydrolase (beta-lactamase superfamily II)
MEYKKNCCRVNDTKDIIKTNKFKSNFHQINLSMKKLAILLSILFIGIFNETKAQQKDSLIKITEGVYEITGFYCNISFLVTEKGVILFDTGNYPDKGTRIQEIIKSVTKKPIKYIVYTHYHGDHTNGIALFPSTIDIIAQKNTVKNLKTQENNRNNELNDLNRKLDSIKLVLSTHKDSISESLYKNGMKKAEELKSLKTVYPTIVVDDKKTIVMGKDTIDFIYPGKGHTDGDLVANIKTRQTMVLGDLLFTNCFPYIDPLGDVVNWSNKLKLYAQSNTKYFIPGHSDLAGKNEDLLFAKYLEDIYKEVNKMKGEGKTLEEIKKSINLSAYENYGYTFLKEQNIEAVYGQLK